MEFTKEQVAFLKLLVSESSRFFYIPENLNSPFEKKAYTAGKIDAAHEIIGKIKDLAEVGV